MSIRAVILVEGESDRGALEALAARLGRDLAAEGVEVVPMGGATNLGRYVERFGPAGADLELAGLCDAREEPGWARTLERAGLGSGLTRTGLERLGFFVCVRDLEDELIRALGVPSVEAILAKQEDLDAFRTFQRQPPWRDRPPTEQLRRFLGTFSGRKIRSAPGLVDALDDERIPPPLLGVLSHALAGEAAPPRDLR
jgi:Overcoming lysogenization defect protein-like, TOPRIM domain